MAVYTWDLEEAIEFCLEMNACATAKASKKVVKRALGGAAQGARTARKASEAQGGLGGAALRVQEPPSSSSELVLYCFPVPCMNNSMYGKKMRHVHLAGFVVESDEIIRCRRSDDKAMTADILRQRADLQASMNTPFPAQIDRT